MIQVGKNSPVGTSFCTIIQGGVFGIHKHQGAPGLTAEPMDSAEERISRCDRLLLIALVVVCGGEGSQGKPLESVSSSKGARCCENVHLV